MAITPTLVSRGDAPNPGTDVFNPSCAFTSAKLYLVAVEAHRFGPPNPPIPDPGPAVTGCGLTWTHVGRSFSTGSFGAGFFRVDLFAAVGAPTPGNVVITYPAGSISTGGPVSGVRWIITEWDGVPIGTPLAAVRQVAAAAAVTPSAPVYLAPLEQRGNVIFCLRTWDQGLTITPGPGYVVLTVTPVGAIAEGLAAEYGMGSTGAGPPGPSGAWIVADWGFAPGQGNANAGAQLAVELGVAGIPWLRQKQRDDATRADFHGHNAPTSVQRGIRSGNVAGQRNRYL